MVETFIILYETDASGNSPYTYSQLGLSIDCPKKMHTYMYITFLLSATAILMCNGELKSLQSVITCNGNMKVPPAQCYIVLANVYF